jgi:hypothetical protein
MIDRRVPTVAWAVLTLAGCASQAPQPMLAGTHSAQVATAARSADSGARPPVIPVDHVFELTNAGAEPAVIVSHRTRIDTTWHFADSGDAVLPRSIGPGETVLVSVTGKVRRPGPQRFTVALNLASGDVVDLELLVD